MRQVTVAVEIFTNDDGDNVPVEIGGRPIKSESESAVDVVFMYLNVPGNMAHIIAREDPIPANYFGTYLRQGQYWTGHRGGHQFARSRNGGGPRDGPDRKRLFFDVWEDDYSRPFDVI